MGRQSSSMEDRVTSISIPSSLSAFSLTSNADEAFSLPECDADWKVWARRGCFRASLSDRSVWVEKVETREALGRAVGESALWSGLCDAMSLVEGL